LEDDPRSSKFRSSKLSRLLKIGGTIAKASSQIAMDKVKRSTQDAIKMAENVQETTAKIKAAKEIIKSMGELKGGLMKVGQMISMTEDLLLPKEITALFASLQNTAPAMEASQVDKIFLRNFGKKPEEMFDSFNRKPIAAASIGQVHEAFIGKNQKVAIKIQYPKIVDAIKNDLSSIDMLDNLFSLFIPDKPQIRSMLEETRNVLLEECDYQNELNNIQFFKEKLEGEFKDRVHVPTPFPEYSSNEILTLEYVYGDNFDTTLSYNQRTKDELGELSYHIFMYSFFNLGKIHTDPQHGNFFYNQSKITILDFGSTKKFSEMFMDHYTGLLISVERSDIELFKISAIKLGMIRENDPLEYIEKQFDLIKTIYGPFLKPGIYPIEEINPFQLVKEFFNSINLKGKKAPNEEFLLLDRANIGLFSKAKAWNSYVDWEEGRKLYRYPYSVGAIKRIVDQNQGFNPTYEY